MTKGSGIATYAKNLNNSLQNLKYRTQILYGPEQAAGRDDLLNEVSLFDAPPQPSPLRWLRSLSREVASLGSPLGRKAVRIAPSGHVITDHVAHQAPRCDDVWSIKDVFHSANRAHAALGRFTPIKFGDTAHAPDVMHWTCPLPLHAPGRANAYTIHDLVPLRLPFATLDNKRRFLGLCRHICASADRIVTVSEHSKKDLIQILGVDEARIDVTYQAVHLSERMLSRTSDDVAQEIEGVFGLDWRGYFIFFGAIEPKKNLMRIIDAYLGSGVQAPLIIVGGKAWLDDHETQMLYSDLVEISSLRDGLLRRADRIRRYDYLPFPLLVSLIRGAKATFLPSLYEGFGLPVLEAMLLGTPVLTSTAGSLPEIAGEAAVLVDPYDTQAIRKAIVSLDADTDLRAELIERGYRQAAKFSPLAYEARLSRLYQQLG